MISYVHYHNKKETQGLILKATSESREASWITTFCGKLIQKLLWQERKTHTL